MEDWWKGLPPAERAVEGLRRFHALPSKVQKFTRAQRTAFKSRTTREPRVGLYQNQRTALMIEAALKGELETLKAILSAGVDIDARNA